MPGCKDVLLEGSASTLFGNTPVQLMNEHPLKSSESPNSLLRPESGFTLLHPASPSNGYAMKALWVV